MSAVMRQKADGADTIVSLPHLSSGEKLYVTNIGKMDLEVLPKGHNPIPPGETRLYERHKSGAGIVVTIPPDQPAGDE